MSPCIELTLIYCSVGDPDPETDPHVFGPPGSGSINNILTQNFSKKLNFLD
jgi:hypothetical protein